MREPRGGASNATKLQCIETSQSARPKAKQPARGARRRRPASHPTSLDTPPAQTNVTPPANDHPPTQAASPPATAAAAAAAPARTPTPTPAAPLKKHIIIFEVAGGTDKGPDGHRKDTMPIVNALEKQGWSAEVLFYSDATRDELFSKTLATADGFMMRVNPGVYEGFTDAKFMAMGRELHAAGCHALQHPDVMLW